MTESLLKKPIHVLVLLSGICCLLLLYRLHVAGTLEYLFMSWNLFLAWVPLLIMRHLQTISADRWHKRLWIGFCLLGWLLFLPNAPYIITDLIHLRYRQGVPLWYDSLMVFSFASTGLYTGMYSILLAHRLLEQHLKLRWSWMLLAPVLGLTGFGIYLGRFSRWNSWDLLTRPHLLASDIFHQLLNPTAIKLTFAFTVVLTLFYLLFVSFIQLSAYESSSQRRL